MNMSYCRFENTDRDLQDCERTLEAMAEGSEERLSERELAASKRLVARCLKIAQFVHEVGGLESDTPLDEVEPEALQAAMHDLNDGAPKEVNR